MNNNNLTLQHVSGTYSVEEGFTSHLNDITITAYPKEITLILGPSGSGKTTLLSVIGLLSDTGSGSIQLNGNDIHHISSRQKEQFRSHNIGYLFSNPNLVTTLSVEQNVLFPSLLLSKDISKQKEITYSLLERVGLANKRTAKIETLSIEEQQLVALIRALVHKPSMLLADEPTALLDTTSGKKVLEYIRQLTIELETITIIATHDNRIEPFADKIYYIEGGKIRGNLGSESMQQHVLRDLTEGAIIADSDDTVTLMNHQAEKILGWNEIEILNKKIDSWLSFTDPQLKVTIDIHDIANTDTATTVQTTTKSGKTIFLAATVLQTTHQNVIQTVITFRDITAEYLLKQQQSMFLHEMTHYLRTPMTVIKGTVSELSSRQDMPDDTESSLKSLKRQSFRLESELENLLLVANLQTDISLFKRKVNVSKLIQQIIESYEEDITNHSLEVTVSNTEEDTIINADQSKLHTALANLIENAVKFTQKGSVTIMITRNKNTLSIVIADSGQGIPQEQLDKVFNRFHYVSAELQTTNQGVGVGLFLAQKVIELHEGILTLESEEGVGTTVTVTLPAEE